MTTENQASEGGPALTPEQIEAIDKRIREDDAQRGGYLVAFAAAVIAADRAALAAQHVKETAAKFEQADGAAGPVKAPAEGEREAFEEFVSEGGKFPACARRCVDGEYQNPFSQTSRRAWCAALSWQARTASNVQPKGTEDTEGRILPATMQRIQDAADVLGRLMAGIEVGANEHARVLSRLRAVQANHWAGDPSTQDYASTQAPAPAHETADTRDEDDLHTIERAADLLEGYAAYIRNDGAENLQYHPYLPEVDMTAEGLRMYATKMDVLAVELDTAIRERDEARQEPWPEWTTNILKMVREVSGYDGYDDAEGIDVEEEVRELIAELTSQIERLRASQAPAVKPEDARDAARYRWLRDKANRDTRARAPMVFNAPGNGKPVQWTDALYESYLDEAMDAAMASQPPVQGSE